MAGYLMHALPGRVRKVLLNTVAPLPGTTDERTVATLIQGGRWDAAFQVLGNPALGFDFRGSPFGRDSLDMFPLPTGLTYADVFTGLVFYEPLERHRMLDGIPGIVDPAFAAELRRRFSITSPTLPSAEVDAFIREQDTSVERSYDAMLAMEPPLRAQIARWLRLP